MIVALQRREFCGYWLRNNSTRNDLTIVFNLCPVKCHLLLSTVVSFLALLEKSCPFCYIEELASWSANMLLTVRQVLSYQKLIYMIYLYFFTRCIFVCNPVLKNDKINSQSSHVFHAFIVFHINFSHACQICHLEGRLKAFEKQKKDIIPST